MATEKVTYELSLRDLMSKGLADINAKMATMEGKLGSVEKKATSTGLSMSSAFKMIGAALAASGIASFGKEAILATAKMQSLSNAIKFASDNSTQGELSMQWLSNFSGKWGVDLNAAAEEVIKKNGCYSPFLNYPGPYPYPASTTVSINEEMVHGIPGKRKLKEGDIVSVDCGTVFEGWVADSAFTAGVGEISEEAKRIIDEHREERCSDS